MTDDGSDTTITISLDDSADLTSFSSFFLLDAPDQDSDVDLTDVSITAFAKDITDGSQTGSDGTTTTATFMNTGIMIAENFGTR